MTKNVFCGALCLLAVLAMGVSGASVPEKVDTDPKHKLTRPDNKPADMTKPVKVFILMGQSNMVGMGDINPETEQGTLTYLTKTEKKYPFLVDDDGKWTVRKDVYYYDARVKKGSPLSPISNNGASIGPELGFGYVMGYILDEPVLILKSCIGNRSLGWDLLPPGSERYIVDGRTYAGYKDTPDSWVEGQPKKEVKWYAGKQYDDDMANAKAALESLAKIYPGYKGQGYEVAGFVWWQGHKDQNPVHASRYEQNLVRLIQCLRKDYGAPNAKFVLATIAFGGWKLAEPGLTIANAQLAVGDPKKHPEFAGNVKCIEARGFWREADVSPNPRQGYHYNRNAETYMEVGLSLGGAMAELLNKDK
jgi:alpha-galactosidase